MYNLCKIFFIKIKKNYTIGTILSAKQKCINKNTRKLKNGIYDLIKKKRIKKIAI